MRRARGVAIALVAAALVVLLLDWTLGAFDVLYIRRLDDVRRAREAMEVVDGGALALQENVLLHLGDGAFALRTDARGLRVPSDGRTAVPGGGVRVAVLGDGAVLGWGVDDALTFARRLEPRLRDLGRPAEVCNVGQLFAGPGDLPAIFDARIAGLDPALLVVCGPMSDRALPDAWREIESGKAPERPWWGRVLPSIWAVSRRIADGPPTLRHETLELDAWEHALAELRARCERRGARIVAADLGAEGLPEACARAGVECVRVVPADGVGATTDATRRFPSVTGHSDIAELLGAAIAPRLPTRSR